MSQRSADICPEENWAVDEPSNNTIAPGHIILGALLAWLLPLTGMHLTDGTWPRLHRPIVALRLAFRVMWDIVVSNIEVARRVFRRGEWRLATTFLLATACLGVAFLASQLTAWRERPERTVRFAEDRSYLLLHALHVDDAEAIVASIKARYEAPLKEIYE